MPSTASQRKIVEPGEYLEFQAFLEEACGIVLGLGKEYLVASRLNALLTEYDFASVAELLRAIKAGGQVKLKTRVIDAMTTNETFWFRDTSHFQLLQDLVFSEWQARQMRPLRIWSAACSSGQEPYTISMTAEDFRRRNPGKLNKGLEIVATDISTRILKEARRGVYCSMSVSRGLTPQQQQTYFIPRGECLEVRPEIRRPVVFRELNLTGSYALLGRFDVIFCRNVLIYFSGDIKNDILLRMAKALNPGGILFLGSTESISGVAETFNMIAAAGGIAYQLKAN